MNLIFAAVTGSRLYGTNRPDSDIDIRGVCFDPIDSLLGLDHFEQYSMNKEDGLKWSGSNFGILADDVTVYGLTKFFRLCIANNPNIIELLFADNLIDNSIWKMIVSRRHLFLSTKIAHTFSGYASDQLYRIKGHKKWIDNPPIKPDPMEHGMVLTKDGGQLWTNSNFHNKYKSLLADYTSYNTWLKNRNPARKLLEDKFGYDTKHASHLYRLILEAKELLLTGNLTLPLRGESLQEVKSVLNGEVKYEDVVKTGETCYKLLVNLAENSVLPKKPDYVTLNRLLVDINKEMIDESFCRN